MKSKIQIKSFLGNLLFEYETDNNTIKKTLEQAVKENADLSYADLRSADLSYADLRSADLSYADLSYADLRSADLRSADLSYANLRSADLSYANLRSADIDFSCLSLSCKSLRMKTDRRIRVQIAFHWLSLIKNCEDISEDEKEMFKQVQKYANEFHRTDVEKLGDLEV